jgi:threonine aldolase
LAEIPGIKIDVERVVTNIVIFDIADTGKTSAEICAALKDENIIAIGFGNAIRMVTHCDVSSEHIEATVKSLVCISAEK